MSNKPIKLHLEQLLSLSPDADNSSGLNFILVRPGEDAVLIHRASLTQSVSDITRHVLSTLIPHLDPLWYHDNWERLQREISTRTEEFAREHAVLS